MQPIGVYLHIPFCAAKCPYCDFYSLPVGDAATGMGAEESMDAYLAAAQRRLQAAGEAAGGLRADTVYFGGGTPSVFGAARLTALLEAVRCAGALEAGAEITAEVNPCSATPALLAAASTACPSGCSPSAIRRCGTWGGGIRPRRRKRASGRPAPRGLTISPST